MSQRLISIPSLVMAPSWHTMRILYASGGSAPLPLLASLALNPGYALARHASRSDERCSADRRRTRSPEGSNGASNQRLRAPGSSGRRKMARMASAKTRMI